MKVWCFGVGTYFAHFQVIIAKKIDIENHNFAQVIIGRKNNIENDNFAHFQVVTLLSMGNVCCRGFKLKSLINHNPQSCNPQVQV